MCLDYVGVAKKDKKNIFTWRLIYFHIKVPIGPNTIYKSVL